MKMAGFWAVFAAFGIALGLVENCHGAQYFGKLIGKLSELHHGVSGEVYAVDARTLYIKDFTYDGQGPAAYFYANIHKAADKNGFRLRDETGSGEVIRRYRKEGITLTLPEGKTIHNIKIFYLWCEEFEVNFGDVKIPRNFDYPRPQKIEVLKGVHSISSDNIVIVDAQTLLIPNLSYDGEAPDAKFWVGRGPKPSPQGIRVPDENGKEVPLRRYDRKTVVLTLPGDLTVFDIGHFGIWCEMFTVDFGHVIIPQLLNIPPSLKMLGVSPQKLHHVGVPSTTVQHSRQFVGGHLQATTFRPPSFFSIFGRKNDDVNQQNSINYVPQQVQVLNKPTVQYAQFNTEQSKLQAAQYQPFPHLTRQPQQQFQQINDIQQTQLQAINRNPQQYQQLQQLQVQPQQLQQLSTRQQFTNQALPTQQQLQQFNAHLQQTPQPFQQSFRYVEPQINYAPQSQENVDIRSSISLQYQPFAQESVALRRVHPALENGQYNAVPFNENRRQYTEQQAYNQYLQEKKFQEEQLRAQLNRQYNRFQLNGNQNNGYTPLG